MERFKNMVVTEIYEPVTVFSKRGRVFEMNNRDCYGLSFCLSGQITYQMNGKEYVSRKGTAMLLPLGATYTLHGDADGLFPLIDFDATGLDLQEFLILPVENEEGLIREYEEIKNAYSAGKRMQVFERFYGLLDRVLLMQGKKPNPLSNVLEYIEKKIGDPALTNESLAAHLGVSEVYFRKLFLSDIGATPKQYILNLRIHKAKQLLSETSYTVTAIAELCGFGSLYHFCRAFKGKVGQTPTQYAEANKIYKI